jgi:plasmid stabilization system protein ParE
MKVIYTDEALRDLDEVLTYIDLNYPTASRRFSQRLRAIELRIGRWPKSAEEVEQRPGVRVVPFIQYPYKIFYRITEGAVEILHVHHAARQEPRVGSGAR